MPGLFVDPTRDIEQPVSNGRHCDTAHQGSQHNVTQIAPTCFFHYFPPLLQDLSARAADGPDFSVALARATPSPKPFGNFRNHLAYSVSSSDIVIHTATPPGMRRAKTSAFSDRIRTVSCKEECKLSYSGKSYANIQQSPLWEQQREGLPKHFGNRKADPDRIGQSLCARKTAPHPIAAPEKLLQISC
ncbi:hypothetical protein F8A10_13250 [Paracoccus kondratievae]|uniref:hypothetical protein n=1 Tax=Paracoccus kondratievae TaxID=135740 RepID=UPI0012662787|nr:hypothetical protein [Paracoccus kondratievae]QFQ88459.1 hypothetical protein F8A10_13250 [Paracoccus kondratievae]